MSKGSIFLSVFVMVLVALAAFAVLILRDNKPSHAPFEEEGVEQGMAPHEGLAEPQHPSLSS